MKNLIPVLVGGAAITATVTSALAQAHGALVGRVSMIPYSISYGISAILVLTAGILAVQAHLREGPEVREANQGEGLKFVLQVSVQDTGTVGVHFDLGKLALKTREANSTTETSQHS